MNEPPDRRPIVVALAGPNGAGKSSFYATYLKRSGLPFINADQIALAFGMDAYKAAELAQNFRASRLEQLDSFIFETVFSDPVGAKLEFLQGAQSLGYSVLLVFIGIDSPQTCEERVAMRVSRGGHDVPPEKVQQRYGRTMKNVKSAFVAIDNIRVYDNSDLDRPYRMVASREEGRSVRVYAPIPAWLKPLLPDN